MGAQQVKLGQEARLVGMAMTTASEIHRVSMEPSIIQFGPARPVYHVSLKEDEGGWIVARCIEIPAAITQGKTREEAIRRSFEAIGSVLDVSGRNEGEFVVLPIEG